VQYAQDSGVAPALPAVSLLAPGAQLSFIPPMRYTSYRVPFAPRYDEIECGGCWSPKPLRATLNLQKNNTLNWWLNAGVRSHKVEQTWIGANGA